MSYIKQNFQDGQVLTAAQMNHIEDGVSTNSDDISTLNNNVQTINETIEGQAGDIDIIKSQLTSYSDLNNDGNISITYQDNPGS